MNTYAIKKKDNSLYDIWRWMKQFDVEAIHNIIDKLIKIALHIKKTKLNIYKKNNRMFDDVEAIHSLIDNFMAS